MDALHFYGGRSDIATINDYIDCLELTLAQRQAKLIALFLKAFAFIKDPANWRAILTLAEYIISSKKNIIVYEDIANEVSFYKKQLKGKRILCPCDWDESYNEEVVYKEEGFVGPSDLFASGGTIKRIDIKASKKKIEKSKMFRHRLIKLARKVQLPP